MMPPGLINGLSDADVNDLLSYLRSVGPPGYAVPVIRVKAGGDAITGAAGVKWEADAPYQAGFYGYEGGNTYTADRLADPLLKTCRYGNLDYRFDLDNGDYDVTVITSEPYFQAAGQRVFSISANGQPVAERY